MANLRLASGSSLRLARAGLGADRLVECPDSVSCENILVFFCADAPNAVTLAVSGMTLDTSCRPVAFFSGQYSGSLAFANGVFSLTKATCTTGSRTRYRSFIATGGAIVERSYSAPGCTGGFSTWTSSTAEWRLEPNVLSPGPDTPWSLTLFVGGTGGVTQIFFNAVIRCSQYPGDISGVANDFFNIGGVASVSLP